MTDRHRWTLLIDRYLAGECSDEERAAVQQLLETNADFKAHVAALRPWSRADVSPTMSHERVERALRRVHGELARNAAEASRFTPGPRTVPTRRASRYLRAAVLLIGSGLGLWVGRRWVFPLMTSRVIPFEVATARAERAKVTLPDGSRAMLAPDSRLTYVSAHGARELTLVGEAYFDVVHDPRHPFTVRAGNALTSDVGTGFAIRDYPGDTAVQIAVATGRVAVRASDAVGSQVVAAGGRATVSGSGTVVLSAPGPLDPLLAWRDGRLVFVRTRLDAALRDVARWYDIDIQLGDSTLSRLSVSGSLPMTSATDALNAVSAVVGVHWRREGRTVTFLSATRNHGR